MWVHYKGCLSSFGSLNGLFTLLCSGIHAYIIRGSYIYIYMSCGLVNVFGRICIHLKRCLSYLWFLNGPPAPILSGIHSYIIMGNYLLGYYWGFTGVTCTDDLTWPFCAAICYIFRLPGLHTLYYYLYFLYAYTYTTINISQLSI